MKTERIGCDLQKATFDEAKAALVAARVGGEYWGARPPLPPESYCLISVRDEEARDVVMRQLSDAGPIVCVDELNQAHGACDPWHLLSRAAAVYCDDNDDDLVIISALSAVPLFTSDGHRINASDQDESLRCSLFEAGAYISPFNGGVMSVLEAIEISAHWRNLIDANRPIVGAVGFATWKRRTAAALMWSGAARSPFDVLPREIAAGDLVASWKSRTSPAMLYELEGRGAKLMEVEDGFIRSIGLGADCVPPLSLVVDRLGIYFDPKSPSDLEQMLQFGRFPAALIERARCLRELIVAAGISKYSSGKAQIERRNGRRHLLVPGQVEDDRSVQCGGGEVRTNVDLLCRARASAPDAFILYKPHPDVEAGHRIGVIPDKIALRFADEVVRGAPITALIDMVDDVHVNTSLAGFEALLRGKTVTTHGVPFYAGWGLTLDLGPVPERRSTTRTLDELVAAALLLYPRYLDPVSGLPCTAEILIERLARGERIAEGPMVAMRRFQGFLKRNLARLSGTAS